MELAYGLEIPRTLEEICNPRRMALLVYDMQVGILSQLPDPGPVVARVAAVLDAARAGGYRVFFSRHLSLPKEVAGVAQLRQAMAWQRVTRVEDVHTWFERDSPAFPVADAVAPLRTEVVFDKITMSAFEGTLLNIALRDSGIQAIALVGVALEVGIEPTVRHAADLGYIPVVVTDACGGRDTAAMERSLAGLTFAGDSLFTDSATFSGLLRRAANPEGTS